MFLLAIVSKLYYIIGTKSSFHVHSMLKKFQQDLKEPCFGFKKSTSGGWGDSLFPLQPIFQSVGLWVANFMLRTQGLNRFIE